MFFENVLLILLGTVLAFEVQSDQYIIERNKQDVFQLPASQCSNVKSQCKTMAAEQFVKILQNNGQCKCQCNSDKVIFGFFRDGWRCDSSINVQTAVGNWCTIKSFMIPIPIVPVPGWKLYIQSRTVGDCELKQQFQVLDCNGVWNKMNGADLSFTLDYKPISGYNLKNYDDATFDSHSPSIRGKVINIRISCINTEYCVVLKVQGELTCEILTTTAPPSTPYYYSTTVATTNSTVIKPERTEPSLNNENTSPPYRNKSGLIGGVIGGVCILLLLVVLVLIFIMRKKRKVKVEELPTSPDIANDNVHDEIVEDNHSLQPLPSGNDDYSYTYMDAHPIVIEVQSGTALQAQENSPVFTELEKPDSEDNHVYGALQNYDPHIYSALNSPTSKTMHFDSNDGDVIYHNDTEVVDSTVYQELNSNRQSSIEEQYEPLRHSRIKPVDDRIASAAI